MECFEAGLVPFEEAARWQRNLARQREEGQIPDHLLLLEHPPVVTLGRRDSRSDLLVTESFLKKRGISLFKTDRGGRVTYHGPGQLIGYFICHLKEKGIVDFVRKIEETLIRLLKDYHLEGTRDPAFPGVWVGNKKIAALGLHVGRQVTSHGFALNVNSDLTPFQYINPCGIQGKGVTSMEKELGECPSMRDVKQRLLKAAAQVFGTRISKLTTLTSSL